MQPQLCKYFDNKLNQGVSKHDRSLSISHANEENLGHKIGPPSLSDHYTVCPELEMSACGISGLSWLAVFGLSHKPACSV